jgi:hypothetical protein
MRPERNFGDLETAMLSSPVVDLIVYGVTEGGGGAGGD